MWKAASPVVAALLMICWMVPSVLAEEQPAETVIDVSDKEAIDHAEGREVTVQGVVESAQWSRTGKVMNIEFKGTQESRFFAVIFVSRRAEMDEAFGGDVGKALTGATVRLRGVIKPFAGREGNLPPRPQMILERPGQITIVEKAPSDE
jgi:hypothetical protein